jgi:uroporphyrinogen decarboxylase
MPRSDGLSGRERVRLALAHQETDRIPIAMVCAGINPPAHRELEAYLQRTRGQSVETYLEPLIDIHPVAPRYVGPTLAQNQDIWSVRRRVVSYGSGSYDEIDTYPLGQVQNAGDLEAHCWPSPDWFDYAVLPDRIAQTQAGGERCIMAANGNIFETSWYMRGFERMFMDMALDPELVHGIMSRVTDFYVEFFARILTAGRGEIDLVFTADDVAGQNGPLMSRQMWEAFIKPYHERLNATIHSFDSVEVIYHTDGAATSMVDGLIEMGIDILQALQFSADGMDPAVLKDRFGHALCFEGGVSVQTTLPFGTVANVQDEVKHLIRTLGKGGGYILGPSHAIQAGTPPENIVAMFDTAASFYPF